MKNSNYINLISTETTKVLKDMNVDKLFQKQDRVRIAVTGLNRSGKTLFITSLVNQLISGKRLKRLKKDFITKLMPLDNRETREFSYHSIIDGMRRESPKWPKSTSGISKLLLQLEVKSRSTFLPNRILEVEIIDYPGEWLFDLPMFGKSFENWSEEIFFDIKNSIKSELSIDWQKLLREIDLYSFSDGSADKSIVDAYIKYLKYLQYQGFSILQPGRNLQSGDLDDSSILLFTPLPKPKNITPHEDSIYSRFNKRYEKYINTIVEPLAHQYFSQFDRQIVLVDVIKSLQNGYDSFLDMTKAIKSIIEIYKYGEQSFLKKFIEKKIDRVLFAATKADYISSSQHSNYQSLLETIVEEAIKELNVKGINTKTVVLSSVKSTEDTVKRYQGKELHCLMGRVKGNLMDTIEYTGEIPKSFPQKRDWREKMFSFAEFEPTPFPDRDVDSVPHINMDLAIEYLFGDKL
jgi:predicted YcjX-like family ATPase